MATIQELEEGLRKAHAAGNTDHARRFADAIRKQREAQPRADFSGVTARVDSTERPADARSAGDYYNSYIAGLGKSMYDTGAGLVQRGTEAAGRSARNAAVLLSRTGLESAGRAVAQNIGRPLEQSISSQEAATRRRRELDPSFSEDPAFAAGNVVGTLGQLVGPGALFRGTTAGAAFLPTTIRGNVLQGSALGALQPTAQRGEVATNAAIGGLAGLAGTAIPKAVVGTARGARSVLGGLSSAERAAGQQIANVASDRAALMVPQPSQVPGVQRTAAQETGDRGVAALERMVRGRNPGVFGPIDEQNNAARVSLLERLAGTDADLAAAEAARASAGATARQEAMQAGPVDITNTLSALDDAIANSEGRTAIEPALRSLRSRLVKEQEAAPGLVTQTPEDRIRVLENIRLDIGDMLAGKFGGDSGKALAGSRELIRVRDALNDEIGAQVPRFTDYLNAYRTMSAPINRMEFGREMLSRTSAASPADIVGTPLLQAAPYGRAIKDLDAVAASATNFNKAKASDFLTASDLSDLKAIADDMARIAVAQRNVTTNSATDANQYLGEQLANEAAREAAKQLPFGLGALTYFQNRAAAQTQEKMAYLLANPEQLRRVLAALPSEERRVVNKVLLQLSARPAAAAPALAE